MVEWIQANPWLTYFAGMGVTFLAAIVLWWFVEDIDLDKAGADDVQAFVFVMAIWPLTLTAAIFILIIYSLHEMRKRRFERIKKKREFEAKTPEQLQEEMNAILAEEQKKEKAFKKKFLTSRKDEV